MPEKNLKNDQPITGLDWKHLVTEARKWIFIAFTAISTFLLWEMRQEIARNRDYEAATQNVTNRFIGQLEGQGQKQCSDKVLEYIRTVQDEKRQKEGF